MATLAHTVFNVFGVVWVLASFPVFLKLIGFITAGIFGVPNPAAPGFAVDNAYGVMIDNLTAAYKGHLAEISNAYHAEERINNQRNYLRDLEIEEIENNSKNYQTSVYYMDIVNELERMGDFIINISQDLERAFLNKK